MIVVQQSTAVLSLSRLHLCKTQRDDLEEPGGICIIAYTRSQSRLTDCREGREEELRSLKSAATSRSLGNRG